MSDDDVFDQSDGAEKEFADRCFRNYTEKFERDGYREALSEDDNKPNMVLQESFDEYYTQGFMLAKRFSAISSRIENAISQLNQEGNDGKQLKQLDEKIKEIQVKLHKFIETHKSEDSQGTDEHMRAFGAKIREIMDIDNITEEARIALSEAV